MTRSVKPKFYEGPGYEGLQRAGELVTTLPVVSSSEFVLDKPDLSSSETRQKWIETGRVLLNHIDHCGPKAQELVRIWATGCFLGGGDLHAALEAETLPRIYQRRSYNISRRLSIKLELGLKITAREVITLFGPLLTKFGRTKLEEVESLLQIRLEAMTHHEGRDLLKEWANEAPVSDLGYHLFTGHGYAAVAVERPELYSFELSEKAKEFCASSIREAENTCREELGIPRVGEGWIAETELYYRLKERFSDLEVVQHGRPCWLGRQHLDIYFPEICVAVEYQGIQHDQPVNFFGGEKAFIEGQKRDKRKFRKCQENGVEIVYVRQNYQLSDVVNEILKKSKA